MVDRTDNSELFDEVLASLRQLPREERRRAWAVLKRERLAREAKQSQEKLQRILDRSIGPINRQFTGVAPEVAHP